MWRRDFRDDLFKYFPGADTFLGTGQDSVVGAQADDVLNLLLDPLRFRLRLGWLGLDRLFDRLAFRPSRNQRTWSDADWIPAMDVEETESNFVVCTELPGMRKEDIKVSGSKDSLCISGERRFDEEEKKKDYYLSERRFGSFQRSFQVPESVDADKIVANFNRGYRGFQQTYRTCTPAADLAIRRYLDEGAKIAREITARYAN